MTPPPVLPRRCSLGSSCSPAFGPPLLVSRFGAPRLTIPIIPMHLPPRLSPRLCPPASTTALLPCPICRSPGRSRVVATPRPHSDWPCYRRFSCLPQLGRSAHCTAQTQWHVVPAFLVPFPSTAQSIILAGVIAQHAMTPRGMEKAAGKENSGGKGSLYGRIWRSPLLWWVEAAVVWGWRERRGGASPGVGGL